MDYRTRLLIGAVFAWIGAVPAVLAAQPPERGIGLLVWRSDTPADFTKFVSAVSAALPSAGTLEPGGDGLTGALSRALEGTSYDVVLVAPAVELAVSDEVRRAMVLEVVPRALRSHTRLHVIAAGDGGDPVFVRQLAQLTGGSLALVSNVADATAAARRAAEPRREAGTRVPAGNTFVVPPGSGPVTLLVRLNAGAPLRFVSPLNQVIDAQSFTPGLEWFQEGDTAVITLDAPTPGRWRVEGERTALAVYHDLALVLQPASGDALTVRLKDREGEVNEGVLWELSRVRAWLQDDTKAEPLIVTSARAAASSGSPRITIPNNLAATEHVVVALESRTFRLAARYPPDAPAFVAATLVPLDQGVVARLRLIDSSVAESGTRVFANLKTAGGRVKLIVAAYARDRTWHAELPPLDAALEVRFKLKGQSLSGAAFEVETAPVHWTSPLAAPIEREFDAAGRVIGQKEEVAWTTGAAAEPSAEGGDATSARSPAGESAQAPTESLSREGESGSDPASVHAQGRPDALIVIGAIALGLVANALLLFALIRRTGKAVSAASTRLSAAIDGYRQVLEARNA